MAGLDLTYRFRPVTVKLPPFHEPRMGPRIRNLPSTTFAGERLSRCAIAEIQETVQFFPALSRSELVRTVYEQLGWHTPEGTSRLGFRSARARGPGTARHCAPAGQAGPGPGAAEAVAPLESVGGSLSSAEVVFIVRSSSLERDQPFESSLSGRSGSSALRRVSVTVGWPSSSGAYKCLGRLPSL